MMEVEDSGGRRRIIDSQWCYRRRYGGRSSEETYREGSKRGNETDLEKRKGGWDRIGNEIETFLFTFFF